MHHSQHGLSDERGYFYQNLGLLTVAIKHRWNAYTHVLVNSYTFWGKTDEPDIVIGFLMGMGPWFAGEKHYWIDLFALTEPYLARLPAKEKQRIGHYVRMLPVGYLETLVSGKNKITSPVLALLYDDVMLASRGEIWSLARWRAIG